MPSYDFKCNNCELVFTVSKSMEDSTVPLCPECSSRENVSRVWGCINFGGMSNNPSSSSCSGCSGGSCSTCK